MLTSATTPCDAWRRDSLTVRNLFCLLVPENEPQKKGGENYESIVERVIIIVMDGERVEVQ